MHTPPRILPAALAALLLAAPAALAAKTPAVISSAGIARVHPVDGDSYDHQDLANLFDGDATTGFYTSEKAGTSIVLDLGSLRSDTKNQSVYISEISIAHSGNTSYSVELSDDGSTWTAVYGASNVQAEGTKTYTVADNALYVRYVYETVLTGDTSLYEFEVKGYVTSVPQVISSYAISSFFLKDGSTMPNEGGGGNNWVGGKGLFDGNLTRYWPWPRALTGSYCVIDFTSTNSALPLQEYYVTQILVASTGEKKFTLEYSEDGTTWKSIPGATAVSYIGIGAYPVGVTAKKVRYVWTEAFDWDYSHEYLAEIQVWGMDPDDVPCTHPSWSDWTEVEGSATCTEFGIDERFCTECGYRQTRAGSTLPPLGHLYVTTLLRPGAYRKFGSGTITCSRCDFLIDCTSELEDSSTNKPVDLTKFGGIAVQNLVQFTDISVTSENHPSWGPSANKLIDGTWGWSFVNGWSATAWMATGIEGHYAQYDFGTEIDLVYIDICVPNHDHTVEFYAYDAETETEKKIGELDVEYDGTVIGTKTETKTETKTIVNEETGEEEEVEVETDLYAEHQRHLVRFYETPVKTLRIRAVDEIGIDLWGCKGMVLGECHPWGTVRGAGDLRYRTETLMLIK